MADDIFCKVISKELPAEIVAESDNWLAFKDINPQAPVHVLVIPKKHLATLDNAKQEDRTLLGELLEAANQIAHQLAIAEKGYRIIINQGEHGGQLVPHLHIHVLGGKHLGPKIVS